MKKLVFLLTIFTLAFSPLLVPNAEAAQKKSAWTVTQKKKQQKKRIAKQRKKLKKKQPTAHRAAQA